MAAPLDMYSAWELESFCFSPVKMAQDLNDLEIYVTIMPHKNICATFVPQNLTYIFCLFSPCLIKVRFVLMILENIEPINIIF